MSTHYDTLGIPRDATQEQIQDAYRRLSLEHHPDRKGGDAGKMAAINQAYEVLSDPEARKAYDGDDKVLNQVRQIFRSAVGALAKGEKITNIVRDSQTQLDQATTHLQGILRDSKRQLERLGAARARVDNDMWRELVAEEEADVQQHIDGLEAQLALLAEVRLEVGKFTDTVTAFALVFPTPGGIPR